MIEQETTTHQSLEGFQIHIRLQMTWAHSRANQWAINTSGTCFQEFLIRIPNALCRFLTIFFGVPLSYHR